MRRHSTYSLCPRGRFLFLKRPIGELIYLNMLLQVLLITLLPVITRSQMSYINITNYMFLKFIICPFYYKVDTRDGNARYPVMKKMTQAIILDLIILVTNMLHVALNQARGALGQ